jgi:hypothetical protein
LLTLIVIGRRAKEQFPDMSARWKQALWFLVYPVSIALMSVLVYLDSYEFTSPAAHTAYLVLYRPAFGLSVAALIHATLTVNHGDGVVWCACPWTKALALHVVLTVQ